MAKTRAIVKRRKAVRNIRKITRTMELIATARYKKAMNRAVEADAYTRKITELVGDLSHSAAIDHPLLQERLQTHKAILLVLSSNRGLCGGYNSNVLRAAHHAYDEAVADHPVELEVSGKRGIAYCKYRKLPITRTYLEFEDKPAFAEVRELADRYLDLFSKGQIDRLDVAYTRFVSVGRQQAELTTLLPLATPETQDEAATGEQVEYEFMPSAQDILAELLPVSFKVRLFKCFLDAAVSEQISRMVAMKAATENAGELIKRLSMRYNRARQAQITSEIAEIIGAVNALS